MAFSLVVSELGSVQRSSGIHTERIWGQISPNDHDVARFHYLPARLLTPKQAHIRSRVQCRGDLPWMRNATFIIHTVVASARLILFLFQMATLVLPSPFFPKKDEPNEGVEDWTYTRSINNSDAQANPK
jgi:hypothetical protein